ncbi:PfkB family carbohydrate kinase [Cohaesibacter haloalkalitolerans]|uniref:PfkB family carbohydrate kinase n=1 Tax=Cohaesibacter haloalkalitolerans TaxID=1162980 RepID=UPI000E64A52B|nr:PfkB family carbohydrate kinase [Cohaesibacter haloalkalitolerans]
MTPNSPKPILFVGALTEDSIFRVSGFARGSGKFLAEVATRNAAGMASSAATAAARVGGKTALWASVGDDAAGKELIRDLQAERVDCGFVRTVEGGKSARAIIIVDETGERWIVVDYDPVTQSPPSSLPTDDFSKFQAVMCDVRWPGAAALALDAARAAGAMAILDADVAPRDVLLDLAGRATHLIASEPGASILCDRPISPQEAVTALNDKYGVVVCVTAGGDGTYWCPAEGGAVRHVPGPKVKVVDTLAAGDVFHGTIAQALCEGQPMEDAIRFASAAAALKCTVFGGRLGAPGREETIKLMKETYHG